MGEDVIANAREVPFLISKKELSGFSREKAMKPIQGVHQSTRWWTRFIFHKIRGRVSKNLLLTNGLWLL